VRILLTTARTNTRTVAPGYVKAVAILFIEETSEELNNVTAAFFYCDRTETRTNWALLPSNRADICA
jgi:hypothetical protein